MNQNIPLEFDKKYTNKWGEQFTVDVFKYYLRDVALIYDTVKLYLPEAYFLVDQNQEASHTISLSFISKNNIIGIEMQV